uniref:Rho GTPase-activating protein 20 n=1 Tax=Schistocephalus solidus TaxID=70667 RepID=A0A0X3PGR5_SCHSO
MNFSRNININFRIETDKVFYTHTPPHPSATQETAQRHANTPPLHKKPQLKTAVYPLYCNRHDGHHLHRVCIRHANAVEITARCCQEPRPKSLWRLHTVDVLRHEMLSKILKCAFNSNKVLNCNVDKK